MRRFETLIDEQIRKAREAGQFDDLPGEGQPLRDLGPRRSGCDVWLENKMREEDLSLPLPEGLQLRKDVALELAALRDEPDRAEVRARLLALNVRIRRSNRLGVSGPPSNLVPVNVARFLERWGR